MGQYTGMAMTMGGGIYNAVNANNQGKAEQAYFDYTAQLQEEQAKSIGWAANYQMSNVQQQARQTMSTQRAIAAANGQGDSISTSNLIADTAYQAKLDELAIDYNSKLQMWDLQNQANMSRVAGKNARKAGRAKAYSTLIGSAGQVADQWYNWKKTSRGE